MRLLTLLLLLAFGLVSVEAEARATRHKFSITSALTSRLARKARLPNVKFYFKSQKRPNYKTTIGTWRSNKKANAFGKSDKSACDWAFLGAMKSLLRRAQRQGGDAVVNIISVTKNEPYKSAHNYACVAGRTVAHVALEGKVVRDKERVRPKPRPIDKAAKPGKAEPDEDKKRRRPFDIADFRGD